MIYYIPKPSQSQVHTTSCASELDTSPPAIGPVPIVHTVCQVHADFEHLMTKMPKMMGSPMVSLLRL